MKILLVEDDRLVRATLAHGLLTHGFQVQAAASGQEALELAPSFQPDLALVDLVLPGMSGAELAQRLNCDYDIPVLVLSAYDDQASVEQALTAGALGYLVKPLTVAQILPELKAALAVAHKLKEHRAREEKLKSTLEANRIINLAVGALMERKHLSQRQAYEILRQKARRERRKLVELAAQVVDSVNALNQLVESAGE
jgi:AmiR/NasT family two-component response regulator